MPRTSSSRRGAPLPTSFDRAPRGPDAPRPRSASGSAGPGRFGWLDLSVVAGRSGGHALAAAAPGGGPIGRTMITKRGRTAWEA